MWINYVLLPCCRRIHQLTSAGSTNQPPNHGCDHVPRTQWRTQLLDPIVNRRSMARSWFVANRCHARRHQINGQSRRIVIVIMSTANDHCQSLLLWTPPTAYVVIDAQPPFDQLLHRRSTAVATTAISADHVPMAQRRRTVQLRANPTADGRHLQRQSLDANHGWLTDGPMAHQSRANHHVCVIVALPRRRSTTTSPSTANRLRTVNYAPTTTPPINHGDHGPLTAHRHLAHQSRWTTTTTTTTVTPMRARTADCCCMGRPHLHQRAAHHALLPSMSPITNHQSRWSMTMPLPIVMRMPTNHVHALPIVANCWMVNGVTGRRRRTRPIMHADHGWIINGQWRTNC